VGTLAARNPWQRRKDIVPHYDKPPADPVETRMKNRFSVVPSAIDAVKSLKARIAKQRKVTEDDVFITPQQYVEVLEPFVMHQKLGEERGDYQRRANNVGMLTKMDIDALIQQEMGYLGTDETKYRLEAHDQRAEALRREAAAIPKGVDMEMRPFLVNISWVYEGSAGAPRRRGSPPVTYSIEGVFYGWDGDVTEEAAREYLMDRIADSSSYKAKAIMDSGHFVVESREASPEISGVMEVGGDVIKKKFGDEMIDDNFTTRLNAFFEHENGRVYTDKDFGYHDTLVRYRWSGNKIIPD
jgi:hypothetical protein